MAERDYKAMFKQMDTDGKGGATKEEVRKFLKKRNSGRDPKYHLTDAQLEKNLDKIFRDVDKDGSGSISIDEFVAEMKKNDRSTKFEELFRELDKDSSGSLTVNEVRQLYVKFGIPEDRISDTLVKRKMGDVDADGDKKISFDEFMAMVDELGPCE